ASVGLPPELLAACAAVPLGRCLCGRAAETGQVVEAGEIGQEHHITYDGMAPHGHYCAPIGAGGRTLGVLNLYLKEGAVLTASQRRFIKSVTDLMAENILHANTQEKLAQSQRMESVGRLAGGIAHDFNNILTAIRCYADFIGKDLAPQDPKAADVQEIMNASERAVALTRQLLAFSRRQIMAPKVLDLNKCVANVTNMLKRIIGEEITLTTKLVAEPCLALLDTGQIEQVLVNLVVNAGDAIGKNGEIKIATAFLPPSDELAQAHPDLPRGPLVCLIVKDTGGGMTPEVKRRLFEPFFTTKPRGKGTGLGLSTVFGIVKQSGGDIDVESEPGKGALFRICFPYCEPEPGGPEAADEGQAGAALKARGTVLLVDDEESLARLVSRALVSGGYTVLTAGGGAEALKELERRGSPVDLLLTDVVMPGISGRELAREVTRRGLAARVLYMSGHTDDAIVKHGMLEPGLAFLYKPFTVESLLAKVRAVLDAPAGQSQA
ncbi:MAG TPA: ATP-binding protein, partial [Elusimicrobiales bacterium]|nr:ATP-binding protein [Elusimicrobiales bacterium]